MRTIQVSRDAGRRRSAIMMESESQGPPDSTLEGDPSASSGRVCNDGLRRFLQGAMRLCNAGSAGLSVVVNDGAEDLLCWQQVTGALGAHEGNRTPRSRSPCGICLDTETSIVLTDPERMFPHLKSTCPWISEILVVPLYAARKEPLGTLWFAQHGGVSQFSKETCRLAQQLAMPMVRTIKMLALLESQAAALQAAALHLAQECGRREQAEFAENEARRLLGFKDAEVLEVHHRAKNSIQMAATVLQLQARASASTVLRTALLDAQGRLQALGAVHELLYRDSAATHAVAMPKLFTVIADALTHAFAEKAAPVRVTLDIAPVMLAADHAVPLALFANEVITNAYKHAFTAATHGELAITLECTPSNGLTVRIGDNGVGMNGAAHPDEHGLGLKLVQGLASQLGGVISFGTPARGSGTVVTLAIDRVPLQGVAR